MSLVQSFPPVIDERARVLVLGSMPGTASLEKFQYYGHPRNYFWPIVYRLLGVELDQEYEQRLAFAQDHHIALWDVIAMCKREGSLDMNIKEEQPNDIPSLLRRYPAIECLAFNGSKAYETFQRAFMREHEHDAVMSGVIQLKLPSTSPVPTPRMRNIEDRLAEWRAVVPFLKI